MLIFTILTGLLIACEKEHPEVPASFLASVDSSAYYNQEFLNDSIHDIYGLWKIYRISGGFHGQGYEPDFEYLELKPFGIYGLVRHDTLFENGYVELLPFAGPGPWVDLKIRFIKDYPADRDPYYGSPFTVGIGSTDTLHLNTIYPDMYSYHFRRVR